MCLGYSFINQLSRNPFYSLAGFLQELISNSSYEA